MRGGHAAQPAPVCCCVWLDLVVIIPQRHAVVPVRRCGGGGEQWCWSGPARGAERMKPVGRAAGPKGETQGCGSAGRAAMQRQFFDRANRSFAALLFSSCATTT